MREFTLQRYAGMLLSTVIFPSVLMAQDVPTDGRFIHGTGSIQGMPSGLVINQTSTNGIVNWNTFSVGAGAAVHFNNGSGATLNRVTGNIGSRIDGSLTATGSLYLVNGAGIVVGRDGMVSTGGHFFASTHDVSNADFLARRAMTFAGRSQASVINLGTISSAAGDVALIARAVDNQGSISAPGGTVGLLAGYEILARDEADEDGLFAVIVGGSDTEVKNSGTVDAANAELRANGGNVYALAGNTGGVIKATGATSQDGRIFLTAGEEGKVSVSGTVSARRATVAASEILPTRVPVPRPRPADAGGDIRIAGGKVVINGTVDASGTTGDGGTIVATGKTLSLGAEALIDVSGASGGVILIGGDYQGGANPAKKYLAEDVATADTVTVAAGARIAANGSAGAGGRIVVWSDRATSFAGTISATGAGAAKGGDAEVSGKTWLDYRGLADLRSESGAFGTLLLDPRNITISTAASSGMTGFDASSDDSVLNVTTLTNALAMANVIVTTGSTGAQAGNITVAAPISWGANSVLTLRAAGNILINANITATGAAAGLVLQYGAGADYVMRGGAVTLSGSGATLQIGESGALNTYTLIRDVAGLQAITPGTYYALAGDIDATATSGWNGGAGFDPVQNYDRIFTGLGHTINGLTINRPSQSMVGLFGLLHGAVRDVTLSNVSVSGNGTVGSVVARLSGGTMTNVHATGTVTGANDLVGGLVGWNDIGTIAGSSSTVRVTGRNEVGGLVGRNRAGTISNSYATGSVTGTGGMVGGLIGSTVAGATLTNVYASGAVSGVSDVGGLIGAELDGANAPTTGTIAATDAYWDYQSTGQVTSAGPVGGGITAIDGTAARSQATYAGFDFTKTWVIFDGDTRPMLRGERSTTVYTPHQLQLIALNMADSYRLAADIDLTAAMATNAMGYYADAWGSAGFLSIGTCCSPFSGSFDGQNRTITGLRIDRTAETQVGLFGRVSGSISNVKLSGGEVRASEQVGALVGYLNGGSVTNSSSSAAVYSNSAANASTGGLVGVNNAGSITRSSATGSVEANGDGVGGLVGDSSGSITESYATGNVTSHDTGTSWTGGLVGSNGGTIVRSFASGMVTASGGYVGGFAGVSNGSITDSYATGAVVADPAAGFAGGFIGANLAGGSINSAYSTGSVTGAGTSGGFAGSNAATMINSFWNTTTSGIATGIGSGAGGVIGLTTTGMQTMSSFVSSSWDIGSTGGTGTVWRIYAGQTSPLLRSLMTSLTVTGGAGVATYNGSTAHSAVGTLTYSVAGYDPALLSGTASYAASSANAGNYSGGLLALGGLHSSQFGYDITFVAGSLQVNQVTLTVTANNDARTYDGTGYSGGNGVTYNGFVGSDTVGSLGGALVYGGSAQGAANAGTYAITTSGLSSTNYNIVHAAGTLTVARRALTITADSQSMIYGSNAPTLTYSVTGGSLATTASSVSGVGTYGVTQGTLAASANYAITYVGNSVTVARRSITVTADNLSRSYGDANPPLTYTVGGMGVVNGDTLSGALATAAQSQSSAGNYAITLGSLMNGNYAIDFVGGTLTVTGSSMAGRFPSTAHEAPPSMMLGAGAVSDSDDVGACPAGAALGGACASVPHPANRPAGPFIVIGSL